GYYLSTLTWGLGWVGTFAALGGAVLELRRDVVRGLALVAAPVALFVYLSLQARFFSRWLLPAYPMLALLAGAGLAWAAAALAGLRRLPAYAVPAALAVLVVIAVAQDFVADA